MSNLTARQRISLMIGHLVMTAEELADRESISIQKEAAAQDAIKRLEAELAELKKPPEPPKDE